MKSGWWHRTVGRRRGLADKNTKNPPIPDSPVPESSDKMCAFFSPCRRCRSEFRSGALAPRLSGPRFRGKQLFRPRFHGQQFSGSRFRGRRLSGPRFRGLRLAGSRFHGQRLRLPEGGELPDLLPASARVGETSIFVDRFVHLRLTDWLNPPTEGRRLPLSGFGLRFRARHPSPERLPAPIPGNCPICPLSAFAASGSVVRIRILPDRTLLFSLCRIRPAVYIVLSFFVSLPNM